MYRGVCGKTEAKSVGGAEYFVTFIDDKPRFISVYTLKRQKEVSKKFTVNAETVKGQCTGNGGEYSSREFKNCLKTESLRHVLRHQSK